MLAVQSRVEPRFDEARLPNGVRLQYAEQGPRTGPAVLMLHGFSDSLFSFSRVMPLMPPEVRVIAPDLRGHGGSDRPESGYTMADFAGDAIALLDQLQVRKAVVVGHSMSTFVARRIVAKAPYRVSRLVLIGGAFTGSNVVINELVAAAETLRDPIDEQFVREFQMSCIQQPVDQRFMEAVIANSRRLPARLWQVILRNIVNEQPPDDAPQCRTLVIGGRQDTVFSDIEQIALARAMPQGELELVQGIGHSFHWEDPVRFVNALKRFGAV